MLMEMRKRRRRLDAIECIAVLSYWIVIGGAVIITFGFPVLIYMVQH